MTITVTGPAPGQATNVSGRLLDTNAFTDPLTSGQKLPIVSATVRLLGGGPTVTTDALGNFTLAGVPAGTQVIDIDSSTAQPAPGGLSYASFHEPITVIDGVANVIERPLFLPRINLAGGMAIDTTRVQTVENTSLGVSMQVDGTQASFEGGSAEGVVMTISEVPRALAPVALPEELDPGMLVTIQPVSMTFSQPQPITFPNFYQLSHGVIINLWSVDPDTGAFRDVGDAQVSADGTRLRSVLG